MDYILATFLCGAVIAIIIGVALLAIGVGLIMSMVISFVVWIVFFVFVAERLTR